MLMLKMAQQLQCTFPQGASRMYIVLTYVYVVCMQVYSCIPLVEATGYIHTYTYAEEKVVEKVGKHTSTSLLITLLV